MEDKLIVNIDTTK